ncbi:MAG: hypothetical protein GQ533_09710 [Methanosarcinaceae archaeon]|nr:hypothetical protein [Methanosarcinaceae archaeon]
MSDHYTIEDYNKFSQNIFDLEKDKEYYQKMLASATNGEEEKQLNQKIGVIDKKIDELKIKISNVTTTL